jgi:hypothetical protein
METPPRTVVGKVQACLPRADDHEAPPLELRALLVLRGVENLPPPVLDVRDGRRQQRRQMQPRAHQHRRRMHHLLAPAAAAAPPMAHRYAVPSPRRPGAALQAGDVDHPRAEAHERAEPEALGVPAPSHHH